MNRSVLIEYLKTLVITPDNVGAVRRQLLLPFECEWNGWVREETARHLSPVAMDFEAIRADRDRFQADVIVLHAELGEAHERIAALEREQISLRSQLRAAQERNVDLARVRNNRAWELHQPPSHPAPV